MAYALTSFLGKLLLIRQRSDLRPGLALSHTILQQTETQKQTEETHIRSPVWKPQTQGSLRHKSAFLLVCSLFPKHCKALSQLKSAERIYGIRNIWGHLLKGQRLLFCRMGVSPRNMQCKQFPQETDVAGLWAGFEDSWWRAEKPEEARGGPGEVWGSRPRSTGCASPRLVYRVWEGRDLLLLSLALAQRLPQ